MSNNKLVPLSHSDRRLLIAGIIGFLVDDCLDSDQNELTSEDHHARLIKVDDSELLKESGLLNSGSSFSSVQDYYLYYCPFCPEEFDPSP